MQLHVHEWGDAAAPPLVCLHGVTGHGERFRRLAEERWATRFHVLAPDLRGHGRSGWEQPWTNATHLADLVETFDSGPADWVGHSWGGRLVLELAARHPERVRRAVLLDLAIQVLPHVALHVAEQERQEPLYTSAEDYVDRREDAPPRELVLEDAVQHCEPLPGGRLRRRTCQAAVVTIYGELAVEHRVHLDDVEGVGQPRLGDDLHRQVRLAVREPAAHRGADAGRLLGIDDVHVEADVEERRPARVTQRLAHAVLDPDPIDLAHREDARVEPLQQLALALVQ